MKRVFQTSSEVMHLFANKSQNEATNQTRNAFFERTSLYSYGYHYKLALHLDGGAILINNGGYSVTTSKHIGEISQSARHKRQFFSEDIFINNALRRVENLIKKLPNARARKLEYIALIKSIFNKFQDFQRYAKENKIDYIKWSNSEYIRAQIDKRSKEWKRLLYLAKSMNNLPILEQEVKEEAQRQKNKIAKREKALIRSYRLGKSDFVRLEFDLLSLRYETKEDNLICFVHTSQNVNLSLNDSIKAIKSLEALSYKEEAINKLLKGSKIANYTIMGAKDGALIVGCHKLKFKEIKTISKNIKKANLLLTKSNQ